MAAADLCRFFRVSRNSPPLLGASGIDPDVGALCQIDYWPGAGEDCFRRKGRISYEFAGLGKNLSELIMAPSSGARPPPTIPESEPTSPVESLPLLDLEQLLDKTTPCR
jgi:hypothetical protein